MRRLLLTTLLILSAAGLYAHGRTFSLDQGDLSLGVSPGGGGGDGIVTKSTTFRGDKVVSVTAEAESGQSAAAWLGDSFSVEYGLSDTLSVGLKSTGLSTVVPALASGHWTGNLGLFLALDWGRAWLDAPDWGLFLNQSVQFEPLFDSQPKSQVGLINSLTSISTSWHILDTDVFSVSPYLDWGWMLSLPNPYLKSLSTPALARKTVREQWGSSLASDAEISLAPFTEKTVVELGVEARLFRRASLLIGWSRPTEPFFTDPLAPINDWMFNINLLYRL